MRGGAIQHIGTPAEIYKSPANSFVAGFIGKQNFLNCMVSGPDTLTGPDFTIRPDRATMDGHATGKPVIAVVRAESISVSPAVGETPINAVDGILANVSFLGETVQYVVKTDSGLELLSRMPAGNAQHLELHSSVRCSWDGDPVNQVDRLRILASPSDARRITRRSLLAGFAVAGAGLAMSGCSKGGVPS